MLRLPGHAVDHPSSRVRHVAAQHTSYESGEVYVLVHMPSRKFVSLASVADFQTPWTAGQFHHMSHSCQEDRMFFFGRRSEVHSLSL